jgi:hypothetical protein
MLPFLSEYKFFTCLDIRCQYLLIQKKYLVTLFRGPEGHKTENLWSLRP